MAKSSTQKQKKSLLTYIHFMCMYVSSDLMKCSSNKEKTLV